MADVEVPRWVKCDRCGKVKIPEMFWSLIEPVCIACHQSPVKRNSASATARYRQRTGGAYDKAYNRAVRLATARLKERYPMDWDELLNEARGEVGI